jgi:hypothetical protein
MLPIFKSKNAEEKDKNKCDHFLANGYKPDEPPIQTIAEHPVDDNEKFDDETYDLEEVNNALKSEMGVIQIVITDMSDTSCVTGTGPDGSEDSKGIVNDKTSETLS